MDFADLARRLTCATCGHSASQHTEEDGNDFCEEPGCLCPIFSPSASATGESNGERVDE